MSRRSVKKNIQRRRAGTGLSGQRRHRRLVAARRGQYEQRDALGRQGEIKTRRR